MKKITALVLAMVMSVALLTACGNTPAADDETTTVDLTAFYTQLESEYELGSMMDIDEASVDAYYAGLNDYTFNQQIMKMPMMTSVVSEFALLECANAEDAEAVAAILQTRVDDQAAGGAWYPESVELWGQAKVVTHGAYVALFASADAEKIAGEFDELF